MIDKHLSLLTHLLCLCFLAGCENEYFKTGSIHIQLKKPSGYADISLANIPVTLINQSIGCVYTTTTDTNGLALFELTAGICAISANQETTTGNRDYILSGSLSNIQFEANGEERSVEIPLEVSERGRLLISEIYFSGCLWPDGKNVYNKDQYLTLVNNSDDLIFLDGLCIAQAGPVSVTKPSGWMLHTDMKEIPLFMMCWEFPGTGTEYPIQPGERQTIAINAINHTNSEVGVPASLDLSSVEWAFWDPILTGSQISAGVKPLNLVWRGTGFSYLFSMNGPTILLFRPKTDLREWIANPDHIQKEPESFNTLKYLHIPADWVLDIANFVSSTSTVAYTRIPSSMDVSPGIATSGGSGLAMRRKYEQEGKRFRWKDSNNTAEDFEKTPPSLKR